MRSGRRRLLRRGGALVAVGALVSTGGLSRPRNGARRPTGPTGVLALGDSYTVGTGVDPDERWAARLTARLRADGYHVPDPDVIAQAGWTTTDLRAGIEARADERSFDLVTLLIGANDAVERREPAEFRSAFAGLLDRAVELAGDEAATVLVLTIPDYSVTPAGALFSPGETTDRLAAYNRIVREAAAETGARLVDLVPVSRRAAGDPGLVSEDALHPSSAQHERWTERIYPAAAVIDD